MRLDLDTEIRFPDGVRAGVLRHLVVNEQGHAEGIVMSTADIVSRDVIVPIAALSEAPGEVLTINLTPDEIDALPPYEEELMPAVGEGWAFNPDPVPGSDVFPGTLFDPGMMPVSEVSNLPEGEIAISQGTEIWCEGERWGIVDEVVLDDSDNVQAIVGRPDNMEEHNRVFPIGLISEVSPAAVILNCTLADLPTYAQELIDPYKEPDAD